MEYCKCEKPDVEGSMEDGFWCDKCNKSIEPVDYDPTDVSDTIE